MMKILWLAPNFNHYKARFLNHLAGENKIELTILSGTGRGTDQGDMEVKRSWIFKHIQVSVSKKEFGNSPLVRKELKAIFNDFDWVLIPAEKKNIPLLIFARLINLQNSGNPRLFSYNHPLFKSGNGKSSFSDKILTRIFYTNLDRVIFYTQESQIEAVKKNYLKSCKAFWANNTIDTSEVKENFAFETPRLKDLRILFIGRLIPSKKIGILLDYYTSLKKILRKEGKNLKLEIIGDGPESSLIKFAQIDDKDIKWHGTLVEEKDISPIMKMSSVVFLPGLSGLSINHAFSYGRPFITIKCEGHGPEIHYLKDGVNGCLLEGEKVKDVETLHQLVSNPKTLKKMSLEAKATGESLSVENWVSQVKNALLHD